MKPKEARKLYIILVAIALVSGFVMNIKSQFRFYAGNGILIFIMIASLVAAIIVDSAFWRCEYCGKHLGKGKVAEYCKHCGNRIE